MRLVPPSPLSREWGVWTAQPPILLLQVLSHALVCVGTQRWAYTWHPKMGLYLSGCREEQLLVADLMGLEGTSRRVGGGFVWPSFACQATSHRSACGLQAVRLIVGSWL